VTGLVQSAQCLTQTLMIAKDQVANELRWSGVATGAAVAGFVPSVHFGIFWVAASLGIVGLALFPIRLWVVSHLTGIEFAKALKALVGPALATAVMATCVLGVRSAPIKSSLGAIASEVGVGVLSYCVAMRVFTPALWRSLKSVTRVLRGRAALL
jgi:O-antigen/teichoic acid export membrane protein